MPADPAPDPGPPPLEGRIVLWEAGPGWISVDALAAPAGSGQPGVPIGFWGRWGTMPLALAMLSAVERWARKGSLVLFELRAGRDGSRQVRMTSGATWMVVDLGAQPLPGAVAA